MKVTYLIANHNYGRYIRGAIKSALKQTYPCSICVIDDGSTDDSWEVINDCLLPDFDEKIYENGVISRTLGNRIAIKLPHPTGPSFARNVGIQSTLQNTDAYAILDADDENYPTKIEKCVKVLQDENIGIVYADYDILNMESGSIYREYKEPYDNIRLKQECIIHSGAIIRKQALVDTVENTGYYDNNLRTVEDWDLWLRICDKYLAYHIPESLSLVRVHNNNSTNSVSKEIWNKNWNYVANKAKARYGQV